MKKTLKQWKVTPLSVYSSGTPLSVHPSRINGDILVGLKFDGRVIDKAKVTRYRKAGKDIQTIWRNNIGFDLYSNPYYITEYLYIRL